MTTQQTMNLPPPGQSPELGLVETGIAKMPRVEVCVTEVNGEQWFGQRITWRGAFPFVVLQQYPEEVGDPGAVDHMPRYLPFFVDCGTNYSLTSRAFARRVRCMPPRRTATGTRLLTLNQSSDLLSARSRLSLTLPRQKGVVLPGWAEERGFWQLTPYIYWNLPREIDYFFLGMDFLSQVNFMIYNDWFCLLPKELR